MARCSVALLLGCELCLLQFAIGRHSALREATREREHAVIETVETRERDKLKFVAHCSQLVLELPNRRFVEVGAPVERGRTIVSQ